jgi:hypothetical protein
MRKLMIISFSILYLSSVRCLSRILLRSDFRIAELDRDPKPLHTRSTRSYIPYFHPDIKISTGLQSDIAQQKDSPSLPNPSQVSPRPGTVACNGIVAMTDQELPRQEGRGEGKGGSRGAATRTYQTRRMDCTSVMTNTQSILTGSTVLIMVSIASACECHEGICRTS